MKRWILLVALLGCSSKKEEPKPEPKEDKGLFGALKDKAESIGEDVSKKAIEDKAKSLGGDLADKAKDMADKAKAGAEDMADKAKTTAGDVADKAKSGAKDLEAKAKDLGDDAQRKAVGLSKDAITLGKTLKDQVGDLHIAGFDYDLAIDSGTETEREHADKIRGMKVLKVGDYSVGYEQVSKHPLGKVYNWQFRITWRLITGQVAKLSIFTDEELPELELASLLGKLIPRADLLLK